MTRPPEDDARGERDRSGAGEDAGDTGGAPATPTRARTPLTQQIGRVVVLLLIVLFGIFAVTNAQPVDFSWVVGETQVVEGPEDTTEGGVPLIVLLLVSFLVGAVVGGVLMWQTARARRLAREDEGKGGRRAR